MTTRDGRRRQAFPGVPPPGGDHDVDATHVWPGLADELRAEGLPERRDPALAEPITFSTSQPGAETVREGETVRVAVPGVTGPDDEGLRLRVDEQHTDEHGTTHVTLTPLDDLPGDPLTGAPEDGQPREPSSWFLGVTDEATPADVWGGDEPGVGHLGLGQAEIPPEEGSGITPLGWSPIRTPLAGTPVENAPAPELGGPPSWRLGVVEDEPARSDGTAPEGDEAEPPLPGWPIGTPATGLPEGGVPEPAEPEPTIDVESDDAGRVYVRMPCGCEFSLRPCGLGG